MLKRSALRSFNLLGHNVIKAVIVYQNNHLLELAKSNAEAYIADPKVRATMPTDFRGKRLV